jgi:hypothetical protein
VSAPKPPELELSEPDPRMELRLVVRMELRLAARVKLRLAARMEL